MRRSILTLILALAPIAAFANDAMVELKTGGLRYVRSDAVSMKSEDLFISMDKVEVNYVFENTTNKDVESLVAFPMPSVMTNLYEESGVPVYGSDNFLGFRVFVEGEEIFPDLSQRATAAGIDVTGVLNTAQIPLMPISEAAKEAITLLPQPVLADWLARGIVTNDEWVESDSNEIHPWPNWILDEIYYWRMTFPANQQVHVRHTYSPSVGGSAGVVFLDYDGAKSNFYKDYEDKYCIDPPFVNAARKRLQPDGGVLYTENWISYILTTAQNWFGQIGTFHLTIDKGSTRNLVSFCGTGVKKTGPTTFELTYKDYWPERDLNILILTPYSLD